MILAILDVVLIFSWLDYKNKRADLFRAQTTRGRVELAKEQALEYGDVIPEFEVFDLHGDIISNESIKGKFSVFHFFRPENQYHKDVLAYADVLAKQYKNHFTFIAIGQGKLDWLLQRGFRLKNASLVADKEFALERIFKINQFVGATIIVDPDGKIKFATHGLISNDLLRQLIAKYGKRVG